MGEYPLHPPPPPNRPPLAFLSQPFYPPLLKHGGRPYRPYRANVPLFAEIKSAFYAVATCTLAAFTSTVTAFWEAFEIIARGVRQAPGEPHARCRFKLHAFRRCLPGVPLSAHP
eukprot:5073373-Pleurochrysis_carterae.AAC.1